MEDLIIHRRPTVDKLNGPGDIIIKRHPSGGLVTNVPHNIIRHSPTGFECGYGGSGPAELALNILTLFEDLDKVNNYYQDFKWDVIAPMPFEGCIIKEQFIRDWLKAHEQI